MMRLWAPQYGLRRVPMVVLGACLCASLILTYDLLYARNSWSRDFLRLASTTEHAVETFNFKDTPSEQECYAGGPPSPPHLPPPEPIPRIVHFTWSLQPEHAELTLLSYLSIRSALVAISPDEVKLHHTYLNEANPYWQRLKDNVTLVHHEPNDQQMHVAHKADLLRLSVIHDEGGIYLDADAFALRPFDVLLHSSRDLILGHEGGNRWGLCNAVMVARPRSAFVERWQAAYADFDPAAEWNYHSVRLPKALATEHPDEVCALAPTAFFWPTWSARHVAWMHEPLGAAAAADVRASLERRGGALFDGQLAYHAWSQLAHQKYTDHLTPERIISEDTRFNMLVRRFLE